MHTFEGLRSEFNSFVFENFVTAVEQDILQVVFHYDIPGLECFKTRWHFPVSRTDYNKEILDRLLFSLGMAEAISYYKCACPKHFVINCGSLTASQARWWEKLFFNGLGEFLYVNNIHTTMEDLVLIEGAVKQEPIHDDTEYSGILVPVGGGKDSVVSLEVLKGEDITPYLLNGSVASEECAKLCESSNEPMRVRRILDKKIIEMNNRGYLNGHTPFSAVLAFSTVIAAYLNGKKYIALSNESSANESTVKGSKVNHQYSKSYEFETDFRCYISSLTDSDIYYFSLLRPLSELQIAHIFSKQKKYHPVFRSCNAGSKTGVWCCNCPKCLFVYIILSPFLSKEELVGIFGESLLDKPSMEKYFRELTDIDENKPFECVGTRSEVLASLRSFMRSGGSSLLTDRYRAHIEAQGEPIEGILSAWNEENGVPAELEDRVRAWIS